MEVMDSLSLCLAAFVLSVFLRQVCLSVCGGIVSFLRRLHWVGGLAVPSIFLRYDNRKEQIKMVAQFENKSYKLTSMQNVCGIRKDRTKETERNLCQFALHFALSSSEPNTPLPGSSGRLLISSSIVVVASDLCRQPLWMIITLIRTGKRKPTITVVTTKRKSSLLATTVFL